MQISPSVTSGDIGRLVETAQAAEQGGADRVHLDIEDGVFIPSFTVGPRVVAKLRQAVRLPLDVHLQTANPERWIRPVVAGGADLVLFHPEATVYPFRMIALIRECGARAGAALLLATPVDILLPYLDRLDEVLLMSADPEPADSFNPIAIDKARALKARGARVQMDGGVGKEQVPLLSEVAVDVAVVGRAAFGQGLDAVARSIAELRDAEKV